MIFSAVTKFSTCHPELIRQHLKHSPKFLAGFFVLALKSCFRFLGVQTIRKVIVIPADLSFASLPISGSLLTSLQAAILAASANSRA